MHQLRQFLKNKDIRIGTVCLIVIAVCLFRHTYDIDNLSHQILASGILGNQYTWCGYTAIWQQKILEALNSINGHINWYMAWLWVIGIIDLIVINEYIINKIRDRQVKVAAIAIEILFFGIKDPILNMNFTIITQVGLVIGVFGLVESDRAWQKILQIVQIIMSLGLRPEQTLLCIPYIMLYGIYKVIGGDQADRKRVIVITVQTIGLILISYLSNNYLISQNKYYSNFKEYDKLRQYLCDYSIGQMDDTQLIQYINDWMLLDTDTVNIEQMAELQKTVQRSSELYLDNILQCAGYCYYIVIVLIILIFVIKRYCTDKSIQIAYMLQVLGTQIIIMYFYLSGRGGDGLTRVAKSSLYSCLPFVMVQLSKFRQDADDSGKYLIQSSGNIQLAQLLLVLAVCGTAGADIFTDKAANSLYPYWGYSGTPFNMIDTTDTEKYSENELNIIGMGLYQTIYGPGMQYRNKIYVDDIKHIIPDGNTYYGQGEFDLYIDQIGASNPVMALLDRDETYYVYEDTPDRLVSYYKNILNIDVGYERVDDLKVPGYDLPRWRIYRE